MGSQRGFEVREYLRSDGSCPFREWMDELPVPVRARISARLVRFEGGNLGDSKALGAGLWEARFVFGPGYRVYFGLQDGRLVILLAGGDKGSQRRDIARARDLLTDYMERDNDDEAQP